MKNPKNRFIELNLKIDAANKNWPSPKLRPKEEHRSQINKTNRATDALINVFKYFEENIEEADHILSELMEHENELVRAGASSHCLALNIRVEQALTVLRNVLIDKTSRWAKLQADGVLMVYEERGYLTMYQGQKIYRSVN